MGRRSMHLSRALSGGEDELFVYAALRFFALIVHLYKIMARILKLSTRINDEQIGAA